MEKYFLLCFLVYLVLKQIMVDWMIHHFQIRLLKVSSRLEFVKDIADSKCARVAAVSSLLPDWFN